MELLLVRHAIAFERDPKRWPDDDLRPLSPQGIEKIRKAARGLKRLMEPPKRVWTSSLARAEHTARILTETAGWPKAVPRPELSPHEAPARVISLLRHGPATKLALVGHEPSLSQLASLCLVGADASLSIEIRKGGVLSLRFSDAPRAGGAVLQVLVPPRYLRATR